MLCIIFKYCFISFIITKFALSIFEYLMQNMIFLSSISVEYEYMIFEEMRL